MMKPVAMRSLIDRILRERKTLLNTPQIVELLRFRFGVHASNLSVGANLGYLRATGSVDRRSAPTWGKPYWRNGGWHFSTENWWYCTDNVTRAEATAFVRKIRQEVESNARNNQRAKGRPVTYRLPPRTDDMRQMLVDIGRAI